MLDREQFIDIRLVDVIAHRAGKRRAIDAVAVEKEPAQRLSQALKMKENQRAISIDQHAAIAKIDPVIADIPGREVCSDVIDNFNAFEQARK